MSIMSRSAALLIATGAFAVTLSTMASASDVERDGRFKLAMGPMSAVQKNQGQGTADNSEASEMKSHHPAKRHRHVKHRQRPHLG